MRRLRWFLFILMALPVFFAAFGYWQWQRLLADLQIEELHWELRALGLRHADVRALRLRTKQNQYQVDLALENLQVQWYWQDWRPQLSSLLLDELRLRLESVGPAPEATEPFALPEDWEVPATIPQQINVRRLQLEVPCEQGYCQFVAGLRSSRVADMLTLQLFSETTPTPLSLDLIYRLDEDLPALKLSLEAQAFLRLSGETRLFAGPRWQGQFTLDAQPPGDEWLAYLQAWFPLPETSTDRFSQPLHLRGDWNLAVAPLLADASLSDDADLATLVEVLANHLDGRLAFFLDAPSPVPVPGVGEISGSGQIQLTGQDGRILNQLLDLRLNLASPVLPEALADYDLDVQEVYLSLHSQSQTLDLQALPLQLELRTEGRPRLELRADLVIDSSARALEIPAAELQVSAERWMPIAQMQLTDLSLVQVFTASWQANRFRYQLREPGQMRATITHPTFAVKGGALTLDALSLEGDPASWQEGQLTGQMRLAVAEVNHPELLPQPWRWQGELTAQQGILAVKGQLTANDRLTLEHQASIKDQQWRLSWQMPDLFLLGGNSLQQLTPHWPPLLTLARGRIGGRGEFAGRLPEDPAEPSVITGKMSWQITDLAGAYDTTAFRGATGKVEVILEPERFNVSSDKFTLAEIIQGFTLGPAVVAARYQASLEHPADGLLQIQQLESALLGGQLRIPTVELDFSAPRQQLQIELQEIDLAVLLAEHPSSDLAGTGRLSGSIPITLSDKGFSVMDGLMSAEAPGGRLQYRSAQTASIAAGSQGMKIVTDALDDFHYTLLSTAVTYEETGKLLLAVRLEGRNPAIERGRPINFNITVEEDLPAMIASLQLTNQISDVIKKRVQEKMLQRKP